MDHNVWKNQLAWFEYGILGIYGGDRNDCYRDECVFLELNTTKVIHQQDESKTKWIKK